MAKVTKCFNKNNFIVVKPKFGEFTVQCLAGANGFINHAYSFLAVNNHVLITG
jgi:hypothetical protein